MTYTQKILIMQPANQNQASPVRRPAA